MQHLDDGLLHALVDGEVASAELGPIQAHLDGCADCRVRLDEARTMAGESNALIELIEVPAARDDASGTAVVRPPRPTARWLRPLGLAASLALAAGLGYAGGAWQREAASRAVSRIDTGFEAEDRPAPSEPVVPTPPTAGPATAAPETSLRRNRTAAREEQERADERPDPTPTSPSERDEVRPSAQASSDTVRQKLMASGNRLQDAAAPSPVRQTPAPDNARSQKDSTAVGQVASLKRNESEVKRALNEGAAKSVAAAPPARLEEAVVTSMRATPITFYDATTLLGGQLRLIDGMVPNRLEQVGTAVRVVYLLERGELFLEQRREADSLSVTLIGPTLSPDSLGKLRQKIR